MTAQQGAQEGRGKKPPRPLAFRYARIRPKEKAMPYFRVLLHGKGIDVDVNDEWGPMIGFFTTRLVQTSSAAEAESAAKNMVLSEWSSGTYAEANKGSLPELSVESIHETNYMETLHLKDTGYSFYCEEEEEQTKPSA